VRGIAPAALPRFVLSSLLVAVWPAGCVGSCNGGGGGASGGTADVVAATPPNAPMPEAALTRPIRPSRHGGFTGLILRSARETSLTQEQKDAISAIQTKLHEEEPPLSALAAYQTDLVAGIRAGKLDVTQLETDYAAIDKNLLARDDKQADSLDAVHAALDAPSRTAIVTAARARLDAMFRPRPERDAGAPEAGEAPLWVKHRLGRVRAEVGLDEAQMPKVEAMVLKVGVPPSASEALRDQVHKHGDELLTAFEKEDFDAHKLDLSPTGSKVSPHATLEREARLVALVLPILTAEQRDKLANIRQRRPVGRWTAEPEPWSPFEEGLEAPGPRSGHYSTYASSSPPTCLSAS
jgi:Spy/CpxP family protein refolding chaperone